MKAEEETLRGMLQGLKGDYASVAVLLVLYTLQGVPMGLSMIFPLILAERGASDFAQGVFASVSWPFSLKLLWAPIVDAVFVESLGRRKTWVIPCQLLIGLVLALMSRMVDQWLDTLAATELSASFFLLYFLCATQDIAVDGWALTMLSAKNAGWQSTCNSVGQIIGTSLAFVGYFQAAVSIGETLRFWAAAFVLTTTLIAVFQKERNEPVEEGVVEVYQQLWSIMKLPNVKSLVVLLLTWKMPFAAADALAGLRLQQKGMPKETIASLSSYLIVVQLFISTLVTKWVTGPAPISIGMKVYLPRVLYGVVAAVFVYFTPGPEGQTARWVAMLTCLLIFNAFVSQVMFVAQIALFAKVSDPRIGGTYMTFLNTCGNLGGMLPATAIFALSGAISSASNVDGYYITSAMCALCGVAWYIFGAPRMEDLQRRPLETWRVTGKVLKER